MSLIVGINLLRKIYLVSDTRITTQTPSGLYVVKDDFIKSVTFNERISSVAAGNAALAAHILRNLKQEIGPEGYFSDILDIINGKLEKIVIDYVDTSGRENETTVIIIGGYDKGSGKEVNSKRIGEVMSAPVMKMGGRSVKQSIDGDLLNALTQEIVKHTGIQGDHIFNVKNVPNSKMATVEVNTYRNTTERYKLNTLGCYEYAVYTPPDTVGRLDVPNEVVGNLEFRDQSGQKPESVLYRDAEILMNFVLENAAKRNYSTVGGYVIANLVTQHGTLFPTGVIASAHDNKVEVVGEVRVMENRVTYKMRDGQERVYRILEEYDMPQDKSGLELI